ncbi:MAG: hypothetical protein JXR18_05910 [Neptuniibacter sp.]
MIKPMTKALIAAGLLSASVVAQAGLSANIGATSDYIFRGVNLSNGVGMMGGVDYEADNGIYVGAWGIGFDDGDTNEFEYDLYGGYAGEVGDLSYSVGYAGYFYDEADIEFHELNFNFGYEFLSLEVTFGTEDDGGYDDGIDDDYTYVALTGEYEGAYLTYGSFGKDYDGDFVELGYGTTFQGLDMGVAYVNADDDLSSPEDTVYVTISKTFDF